MERRTFYQLIVWLPGRSEREIRRAALRAPLLMVAAFTPFAFLPGALSGRLLVSVARYGRSAHCGL